MFPGLDVALNPATMGTLIAGADGGTRERLVGMLQDGTGTGRCSDSWLRRRAARSALGGAAPRGHHRCARVVSYMDANSPYRADSGWARTNARFNWGGDPAYTTPMA